MRLALAALASLAFSSAAFGYPAPYTCSRNFYVSTAGVDQGGCGGNGFSVVTGAATCASMQGANNNIALQAGDCVNFAAGTYNISSTITPTKGGNTNTASGYVAYVGAPNHGSKINVTGNPYYAMLIETSYLAFDGFDWAANVATVDAVITTDVNGVCQANGPHHIIFINNLVHDAIGGGFTTGGGDYFLFGGNVFHDLSQCTPFGESAVHILWPQAIPGLNPTTPWDTQYYHIQYIDNVAYNNYTHASCPWDGDASGMNADNWQLQNWSASGCPNPNPGMYPFHGLMAGNVGYGNGNRCLNMNSGHNIDVFNNTCYNNGQNTVSVPASGLFSGPQDCEILIGGDNLNIENNIFYAANASLEAGKTICWVGAYGYPEGNVVVHNNDLYNNIGTNGIAMQGTQNDASNLASITAASSNNLLGINPLFNSIANIDFHPQGSSPVVGKGLPIPTGVQPNQPTTNDGFAFSSPPPMGAFNTASGSINSVPGPVSIVAGGPAAAPYAADAGFNGGNTGASCNCAIDTSAMVNPAPQAALQYQRYGQPQFSYVVSGLTPANTYMTNLYFIEVFDTGAGQRQENVSINGQQVLTNFDPFAAAGVQHKVVQKSFFKTPDSSGNMTIQMNAIPGLADPNALINAFQVLNTVGGPVSIIAGGTTPASPFIADAGFSGGTATGPGGWTTDMSLLSNPPPASIFQFQRFGANFYYVVTGLTPAQTYTVNLFFSEDYPPDGAVGKRIENVTINGSASLVNFDIFAATGALHKAILKSFPILADSYGAITILFQEAAGAVDPNAEVDGIQVLAVGGNPPVAQNQSASSPYQTAVQINLAAGATGSPTSAAIVGTPVGGSVSLNGLSATFTPSAGFSGAASFQFTLSNSNGTSNTATAAITVAGPIIIAPVAVGKSVSTQFQTLVTIDLSANATNGPTSATIASSPANGAVSLAGFIATYTPNAGFSGQDAFTFTLSNSAGVSNTATVTIVVNPQVSVTCP